MPTIGVDARSVLCKEPRGEGKTLLRLYEEMLRQRPDLKVWFFGDSAADDFSGTVPPGIGIDSSRSWGHRIDGWENVSLPWRAWRRRCDVLHCASSGAPAWSPVPIVMTVHDLIPALQLDGQDDAARQHFLRRLERGMRQAKHVITVSEHTRRDLYNQLPTTRHDVQVVPWGCDVVAGDVSNKTAAVGRYIVTFGGSARRKNTAYTLERFAAVASVVPDVRLMILGISNLAKQQQLKEQALGLGVGERVDIPGFLTNEELDATIGSATLLLYLSTYEGFGVPVLEAITRGVVVVASDSSSLPEIFGTAPGCLPLEDPPGIEKTVCDLLQSSTLLAEWRLSQSRIPPHFSWSTTAAKTLSLICDTAQ